MMTEAGCGAKGERSEVWGGRLRRQEHPSLKRSDQREAELFIALVSPQDLRIKYPKNASQRRRGGGNPFYKSRSARVAPHATTTP